MSSSLPDLVEADVGPLAPLAPERGRGLAPLGERGEEGERELGRDDDDHMAWTIVRDLDAATRAAVLTEVEQGKAQLAHVPGPVWFNQFLALTMEGYFGDPMYGGNKDKAVWKMIGFPGVPAMYVNMIEEFRNKPYTGETQSIQDFA